MRISILFLILAAAALSACGGTGDGGTSREELLRLAGAATDTPATATPAPLRQDVQPALIEPQSVATATPVQPEAMPEIAPTCDPRTPAPTVALDESDRAAGVIVRGAWPCWEVQP